MNPRFLEPDVDQFLVVASDGVGDFTSPHVAAQLVAKSLQAGALKPISILKELIRSYKPIA